MAHALARRRRDAGDEADDGLLHVRLHPARGILLVRAADLAHHDHRFGLRVVVEHLQNVDVLDAVDRIAADADAGGLAEAELGELADGFISERAGARHDADRPPLVDVPRHDADLDLVRRDDARAVRPDEQGALALHLVLGAHHVAHRDALGDADHEIEVCLDRLLDRGGGARRRHIDHRDIGAGRLLRVGHVAEDRNALEVLAGFLRIYAGDEARLAVGVGAAGLRMELPRLPGDALRHHPRVLVDEDAHFFFFAFLAFFAFGAFFLGFGLGLGFGFAVFAFTAATAFFPASPILSAEMIGSPESLRIFLPRSSFVPFMRTTRGTLSLTSRAADTMPVAMVSHFMMPPKMLTRIAFTFLFDSMILNAAVTRSAVAPPPTSRKLAGAPPKSLMVSIVAMASPAPLTMQAMLPSSEM